MYIYISYIIIYIYDIIYIYILYMSDRQNLNCKMRSSGQSYRFWEFTISFYSISWLHHLHPLANCARKAFYTSTSGSEACLTTLRFLLQRSNCMVWYDTCQCNCKSLLHHPFSNSETSLNSVVGRSGWALTATRSMPFIHLGERSPNRTCRCRCAGVPEMNQDWLKQWSAAKEYA